MPSEKSSGIGLQTVITFITLVHSCVPKFHWIWHHWQFSTVFSGQRHLQNWPYRHLNVVSQIYCCYRYICLTLFNNTAGTTSFYISGKIFRPLKISLNHGNKAICNSIFPSNFGYSEAFFQLSGNSFSNNVIYRVCLRHDKKIKFLLLFDTVQNCYQTCMSEQSHSFLYMFRDYYVRLRIYYKKFTSLLRLLLLWHKLSYGMYGLQN